MFEWALTDTHVSTGCSILTLTCALGPRAHLSTRTKRDPCMHNTEEETKFNFSHVGLYTFRMALPSYTHTHTRTHTHTQGERERNRENFRTTSYTRSTTWVGSISGLWRSNPWTQSKVLFVRPTTSCWINTSRTINVPIRQSLELKMQTNDWYYRLTFYYKLQGDIIPVW